MVRTFVVLCLLMVGCQDPQADSSSLGAAGGSSPDVVSIGAVTAQLAPFGGSGVSGAVSFDIFKPDQSLKIDGELRGCKDEAAYEAEIFDGKSCSGNASSLGKKLNGGLGGEDVCFRGMALISSFHAAELADLTIGKTGGGVDIVGHIAVIQDSSDNVVACGVIRPN